MPRREGEVRERGESRMLKLNRMFDTHPPIEDRIAALREL
jgi:Zn-dependent protease with chaperone function